MKKSVSLFSALILLFITSFVMASADSEGGGDGEVGGSGYLPLKPAFVVNIRDGKRSRFLQVQIQLKLSDMSKSEQILHHDSVIRHTVLMLLSGQEAMELYSTTGKERLRVKALKGIRAALKDKVKDLPIEDLYFTNFIIQ